MTAEPLREVRDYFSEVVDRVERHHERITATRSGRPVAVLISPDDLAEFEETLDMLSDLEALTDILEADAWLPEPDALRALSKDENGSRRASAGRR